MTDRRLRIALLTYRGNPYCGGQGVYVRHLSRELAALGHHVEVLAGQPYPQLDPGPVLHEVPSLDLYAPPYPFRPPAPWEYRDLIDVLESVVMSTAGFPEPLTFSLRALRELRRRRDDFDIVHDNQTLGYGLLGVPALGLPLVTTIHHPVTVDRRVDLEAEPRWWRRLALRRWYGFTTMQGRVARQLEHLITVSETSRDDIVDELGVRADRLRVVPVGVDADRFRPLPDVERVPGRIVSMASADAAVKGGPTLLEAVAKLRDERDVHLIVVGTPKRDGALQRAVDAFDLHDIVEFRSEVDDDELVELWNSAAVAVVPSLYEGFSLPAVEAMACGTPLVATDGGALPEVVGDDGTTGLVVAAGDPGQLAGGIAEVLDDPELAERLGSAARQRVLDHFTWRATAERTAAIYQEIASC